MEKIFTNTKYLILSFLVLVFPFFFLPLTQEYFLTNKLYLLITGGLILLIVAVIQSILSKKIIWQKNSLDIPVLVFLAAVAASTIVSSPNKIQALLNLNFGFVMILSLVLFYFFLSRGSYLLSRIYYLGSVILSLTEIIFFFQPFKNISLPQNLIFLKNPAFSPIGNQLDLMIFLGFFLIISISDFISHLTGQQKKPAQYLILNTFYLTLNLLALLLTSYTLLRTVPNGQVPSFVLPPFRLSWYAVLEVLKNPRTAFFGAGIDNFSSVFTRVKDLAYNQSGLWQIGSFNLSRSGVLHIFTETGVIGLAAFVFLAISGLFRLINNGQNSQPLVYRLNFLLFVYLLICLLIFPTSLIVWFLFFFVLSQIANQSSITVNKFTLDFESSPVVYLGVIIVALGLIIATSYFLGRSYLAEIYFKNSLNGYVNNNAKTLYDNQRQAIITNPYMEKFRIGFSQTNILIANNIILKVNQGNQQSATNKPLTLSSQDKQIVIQAIQAAISEAKAAISLNPQRAANWENLAIIYQNIINSASGADTWAISAYQRAIQADPRNPSYRLSLGGVYYFLGRYDDAISFFTQAIGLKPNMANAYYNYAWALYQKGDYNQATASMKNVLTLIDPKTDKSDYDKASNELAIFKQKIPTTIGESPTENLNLPAQPPTQISPKLELPKEASPSAK